MGTTDASIDGGDDAVASLLLPVDRPMHGGRRSVRSVARSVDRFDRFGRFGNFADFLIFVAMSGSSRSVLSQSFSSVRRFEAEKMPKNRIGNFLNFSVRSVRYSVRFDRYCVRGSWWTTLVVKIGV